MAKKLKPGQKRCPSCEALVNGPRTKNCPKCGHEFNGKPAPKAAPASVAAAKPTKDKAAKTAPEPAPAAVVVEKPAKPADTITLDHVKKVAQTVKSLGGVKRATEMLEVIKELGGVKKFKELAEAITATSTDDVPF